MFGPKAQRQQRQQRQSRPGQRLGAKGLRQISRTFWAQPETPHHKYWLASAPRNERSNKPPFCGSTIKSSSSRSTYSPLLDLLLSENKMELAAIPLPQLSKWDIFIQNARSNIIRCKEGVSKLIWCICGVGVLLLGSTAAYYAYHWHPTPPCSCPDSANLTLTENITASSE